MMDKKKTDKKKLWLLTAQAVKFLRCAQAVRLNVRAQ